MASPAAIAFHRSNMASEAHLVKNRIANGTKASSPSVMSYRRQHPEYTGTKITNPSGAQLFFQNKSDTDAPFASSMIGGVIKDFKAAKRLLQQRAHSSRNIALESAGVTPIESPLLTLSETESRSLELNNLLQQIQDAVDAGEGLGSLLPDLKNVLRLFVALLPTFTASEMGEFQEFFNDQIIVLETKQGEQGLSAPESQVLRFLSNLHRVIAEFAKSVNETDAVKATRARAIVKKIFKIDFAALRQAPPAAPPEPVAGEPPADLGQLFGEPAADAEGFDPEEVAAFIDGLEEEEQRRVKSRLYRRVQQYAEQLQRENDREGLIALYRAVSTAPRADIGDARYSNANIRGKATGKVRDAAPNRVYRMVARIGVPELIAPEGLLPAAPAAGVGAAEAAAEAAAGEEAFPLL